MNQGTFDIFHYTDYRAFLKDALKSMKEKDFRYSQRFIMQKLGIKSGGWLADILSGRKNITRSKLLKLSEILGLQAREELYLETLADYAHAKSLVEKNRAYEKLLSFHEIPKDLIGTDRFEYFSHWYYSAVREYLFIEPFRGDYPKLASSLNPPITPKEAKKAIQLLEKLDFVKKFTGGEYRPVVEHVRKKADAFSPVYYLNYIKANLHLGMEAMERIPKEERDVSALCTSLSEESFRKIQEDIIALRKKMVQLSEQDNSKFWDSVHGDSRRVYQANFQLFPTTKLKKEKK